MNTKFLLTRILNENCKPPTLKEICENYIDVVLEHTKGKKTPASRILGCNRRTLYRRPKA